MRILNQDTNQPINNVLLLLTYQEACEIKDDLEQLILSNKHNNHSHIADMDFKRELTLSIYNENNLEGYQEDIKKIILEK